MSKVKIHSQWPRKEEESTLVLKIPVSADFENEKSEFEKAVEDFLNPYWDKFFDEIERHSRFKVLGKQADSNTGAIYYRVIEYKGEYYCAENCSYFNSPIKRFNNILMHFLKLVPPYVVSNVSLVSADNFPYVITIENPILFPKMGQPVRAEGFRTVDEARERLDFWKKQQSKDPQQVLTHNIPEG